MPSYLYINGFTPNKSSYTKQQFKPNYTKLEFKSGHERQQSASFTESQRESLQNSFKYRD